jgi:hypothetical protein
MIRIMKAKSLSKFLMIKEDRKRKVLGTET